jgi:hypothetical protein
VQDTKTSPHQPPQHNILAGNVKRTSLKLQGSQVSAERSLVGAKTAVSCDAPPLLFAK